MGAPGKRKGWTLGAYFVRLTLFCRPPGCIARRCAGTTADGSQVLVVPKEASKRIWTALILALIGDQFSFSEEVVRSDDDVR